MAKGTIKRVFADKGYGFIQPDERGDDIWFHATKVKGDVPFAALDIGLEVEYETEPGRQGGFQAKFVRALAAPSETRSPSRPPVNYRFLNPYNFVRFLPAEQEKSEKPRSGFGAMLGEALGKRAETSSGATAKETLVTRCAPPPHDRYVGLTGRITCTLQAVTPLFVSDPDYATHGEHKSFQFYKLGGQPALPATSLRGMVRSVFEAATNSCVAHLTGQRLSKHVAATDSRRLWPARVKLLKGKWFLHVMNGTAAFSINGPAQGDLLPAAWLMRYRYGALQSSPTVNYGPNKNKPYSNRTPITIPLGLKHRDECWALLERMTRPDRTNRQGKVIKGFDFWNVKQVVNSQSRSSLPAPGPSEMIVQGWLCITNHNIENKHDERLFFSSSSVQPIRIPDNTDEDKVVQDYEDLISDYQQRHRDGVKKRKELKLDPEQPYITRDKKEAAYSRFILEPDAKLHDDDLVYALLEDGPDHRPRVKFIVPVSVPRVSYERSIARVLEESVPHLKSCEERASLCPACRVFGWVHQGPEKTVQAVAYAGRVRFSHGALVHHNGVLPVTPLAILSSPKPTTTRFYLGPHEGLKGEKWPGNSAEAGYNDPNNELRGRKFYRHHGVAREQEYRRAGDKCDDQNRTVNDALAPGARFEFTVNFENLGPFELGALLWSLEMDGQGYHRLGYAKPLGFGSVKIEIGDLKVLDAKGRYNSLIDDGWQQVADRTKCIEQFKRALAEHYGDGDFEVLENVQDLRILLSDPINNLPVHYPRTARDPDPSGKNFEWFMGNNRSAYYALSLPENDQGLPLITRDGVKVS